MSANEEQVGGEHYKKFGDLQPWDVILKFELGFLDGCAAKYILRWKHKNGVEDLQKAKHCLEKLIEVEEGRIAQKQEDIEYRKNVRQNIQLDRGLR